MRRRSILPAVLSAAAAIPAVMLPACTPGAPGVVDAGPGTDPDAFEDSDGPVPDAAPGDLRLLHAGDLGYLGSFTLPDDDGGGGTLNYGGYALGLGLDGSSLYFGCIYGTALARVSIPAIGGRAALLERCQGVPNLGAIDPGEVNGFVLGGSLAWNGRMIASAYAYYDADNSATRSHFAGPTLASAHGPYVVGTDRPGFVGGYMTEVPPEWRDRLGGPALTGQCCISIISRSSYGPSASVFDPDALGVVDPVPSTMLVGYPQAHPTLGDYPSVGTDFNGATKMGGVAFPRGTRSVLFVGRHASTFCYGSGTPDPALDGQPSPGGGVWCYDPTNSYKGTHGYPYRHQIWAYDAEELAAVRAGSKAPWQVTPYATWALPEMGGATGAATMQSATYDPTTRRWYIALEGSGAAPEVHVYQVAP